MKKKTILLSYIAEEHQIARLLKEWIESSLGSGCQVVSGLASARTPPKKRLQNVGKALGSCSCCVVLTSRASLAGGWVQVEAGAAWREGVPILVLCHSDFGQGDLPEPLSLWPCAETRRANFSPEFLRLLCQQAGLPVPDSPQDILEKVREIERQVAPAASLDILDSPQLTLLIDLGRRIVYPKKLEAAATIARETGGYEREVEKRLDGLASSGHLEKQVDKEGLARYRLKEPALANLLHAGFID
ncbi:MAG: hypothetical protein V3T83_17865 [Acidobacteriota bacterium]